jgi:flavin reductase (DIM6/NTAB) family NADH-FMN oxidoreductase RutF
VTAEVRSHQQCGPDNAEALSPEDFKRVFRRHPAGVAVITLAVGDRLVGFTATSVISVSAEPPLIAFSVAGTSSSWSALERADTVVVNFLSAQQAEVSSRFATSGIDRFAHGGWSRLPSGEPVLDDTPRWVRGRIVQRTPVGSSYLVCLHALTGSTVGQPDGAGAEEIAPLVYHDRVYHRIGDASAL